MDSPTTEQPTTEQPAAEPSAAEQPATLADEELREVAAGADWQYNPNVFDPYRRYDDWLGWGDSHRGRF